MEVILILFTVLAIVIPSIAVIEWVKYTEEMDMEFIHSIIPEAESKEPSSAVRRYSDNYITKLESEADKRMRQANLFYERGLVW